MKCPNCGAEVIPSYKYCPHCKFEMHKPVENPKEPILDAATENNSAKNHTADVTEKNDNSLLRKIIISDKKFLELYSDRLVYHEGTVFYKDIAILAAAGSTSKSYGLISHSTFMGELKMMLFNGEKRSIKVGGVSVVGIGKTKDAAAVFQEILNATYQIIAKAVAENLYDQIRKGAAPELGLVRVEKDRMYVRKIIGKSETVITKEEYGSCEVSGDIYIFGKNGNTLAKIASNTGNAYVLPHLLNTLYH